MQMCQFQMTGVFYNTAERCFQADVTIFEGRRARAYSCAFAGPINMSYADAAHGLTTKALRHHKRRADVRGAATMFFPAQRAGRPTPDTMRMLKHLAARPGDPLA